MNTKTNTVTFLGIAIAIVTLQIALLDWLKDDTSQLDTRLKTDISQLETRLKTDISQLETRLKDDTSQLDTRLKTDISQLETRLKDDTSQLDTRLKTDISQLETRQETVTRHIAEVENKVAFVRGQLSSLLPALARFQKSLAEGTE